MDDQLFVDKTIFNDFKLKHINVSITYILTPRKFDDKIWYLKKTKRLFFDIIEKKYVCINKLL